MRKTIYMLILLFISSCGIGPVKWEGFSNYEKPVRFEKSVKLKTNGVYVVDSVNGYINSKECYYLYNNGLCLPNSQDKNFWKNPKYYLDEEYNRMVKYQEKYKIKPDVFGQYSISNDTICFQVFGANNNEFFRRWVIEDKGIIVNDSTIKLFSSYSYLRKIELLDKPKTLLFYKMEIKPDSTKLFYKNKKWYKKGLHKSRK
ncbi:hypothetical protein D0809_00050 [Flavobacterium circumlabens]|uniref:Lipoprotein n=1 Tax=Flavobacterium circumlabens TaxID=2133765 RepID=A0A4Y7UG48_9FLAO|nr:hypothetical protein [Flavobacterium circumlabens]TCN52473.1 hypothetical protein EV142_11011 [Flavobacterium circumlabens]TEB45443.1 hypothetical protein D0809_00050 [Flavobacterium circumlabens]